MMKIKDFLFYHFNQTTCEIKFKQMGLKRNNRPGDKVDMHAWTKHCA